MPTIRCQFPDCEYQAVDDSEAVAIAMLQSHNFSHMPVAPPAGGGAGATSRAPKIERPVLKQDISDEDWDMFKAEWSRFKRCFNFTAEEAKDQLFQCCQRSLQSLLLRIEPNLCDRSEQDMLESMKSMAVLHLASTVRRTGLIAMQQARGQSMREFFALVRSSATACKFQVKCPNQCCAGKLVDYTACMVKDIFISGLEDAEIKKDILSLADLDTKSDKEVLSVAEEKEVARNAVACPSGSAAALSNYNKSKRAGNATTEKPPPLKQQEDARLSQVAKCACGAEFKPWKRYSSGKMNKSAFKVCSKCYTRKPKSESSGINSECPGEAATIASFIGSVELVPSTTSKKDTEEGIKARVEVHAHAAHLAPEAPAHLAP